MDSFYYESQILTLVLNYIMKNCNVSEIHITLVQLKSLVEMQPK